MWFVNGYQYIESKWGVPEVDFYSEIIPDSKFKAALDSTERVILNYKVCDD